MDKAAKKELVEAVVAFAVAANELIEKWYMAGDGDDVLVGYPESWASFDDLAASATLWANENLRAIGATHAVQGPQGKWVIVDAFGGDAA